MGIPITAQGNEHRQHPQSCCPLLVPTPDANPMTAQLYPTYPGGVDASTDRGIEFRGDLVLVRDIHEGGG